jgi:hypothetical protein
MIALDPNGVILMQGDCPMEEAEALLQLLEAAPGSTVDWRECDKAHTAVIQVLIVGNATLIGPPRGVFLKTWISSQLSWAND